MNEKFLQAAGIGIQMLGSLSDGMLFMSAFNYHLQKDVDFDEALEHTLECFATTKKRIPEFIKEQREAKGE